MIKIILFGKVEKKTEHQDRSKIALRIEWEFSASETDFEHHPPTFEKKIIEIIELNSTQYPLGSMQNDKYVIFVNKT